MNKKIKRLIYWLAGTLIFYLSAMVTIFLIQGGEPGRIPEVMPLIIRYLFTTPLFYLFLVIPFFSFLYIGYINRIRKVRGWRSAVMKTVFTSLLPLFIILGAFKSVSWYNLREDFVYEEDTAVENNSGASKQLYRQDGKHRGVHVFLRDQKEEEIALLVKHNVEWMTIVPYAYQEDIFTPSMTFRKRQEYSSRDSSFVNQIRIARSKGLYVLMKPHMWTREGQWRSEISMATEADWQIWFGQYEDMIMHYAVMAEETGCEAMCIGTELMEAAISRPDNWRLLIKKVRKVFSGKLIYAANWDREYKEITFWDELDYIGVQAYFGLSDADTPTVEQLVKSWQPHKKELLRHHKKWDKPILFTEIGYKSVKGGAHKPWEWESYTGSLTQKISLETQANCYEALFRVFWGESWFAGVHLWRWQGEELFDFTPKNKPAANIMAKWFSN